MPSETTTSGDGDEQKRTSNTTAPVRAGSADHGYQVLAECWSPSAVKITAIALSPNVVWMSCVMW